MNFFANILSSLSLTASDYSFLVIFDEPECPKSLIK